jgi:mRNA interferase YafQ
MKKVQPNNQFKRDLKLADRRGKDMRKIRDIITTLQLDQKLDAKYKPHTLKGKYAGLWECHIEPDWLLIYQIFDDTVLLIRTGSHADLF